VRTKLQRDVEVLEATPVISAPKPVKHKHKWVKKVCAICGKKHKPKYVPPRERVKHELYALLSQIVRWRDGGCVLRDTDGQRCYGFETDSHVYPRGEYGVTFDLLNNHDECQGHNNLHNSRPSIYNQWFKDTFGKAAWDYLTEKAAACEGEKSLSTQELQELLAEYQELWDNRPANYDRQQLIELGYFGSWMKSRVGIEKMVAEIMPRLAKET
jgi:hypothetical protein